MKSSALDLPQLLHCKLQERFLGFDRCSHRTPRWLCCFIMLPVGRPFGLRILLCILARTQQSAYNGRGRRARRSIKSTKQANGSSKQGWGSCIGVFSSGCAHEIKTRVRHGGVGWGACRPAASRCLRRRQGGAAQGKIVVTFGETQLGSAGCCGEGGDLPSLELDNQHSHVVCAAHIHRLPRQLSGNLLARLARHAVAGGHSILVAAGTAQHSAQQGGQERLLTGMICDASSKQQQQQGR